MGYQTGITSLFYGFLEALKEKRERLAPLQLVGKIEAYLVNEFICHIYQSSGGRRFAYSNFGGKGEQKYDIVVLRQSASKEVPEITTLVEAKYLRNRHRMWTASADDETYSSLKSLSGQLETPGTDTHGGLNIALASRSALTYGLVFGSFVGDEHWGPEQKDTFFQSCLDKADSLSLRYHDLARPYWRIGYDDVPVDVLGRRFSVSLWVGLWKKHS